MAVEGLYIPRDAPRAAALRSELLTFPTGNTTTSVTVCVVDALGIPLRHVDIGFLFQLDGGGTGSVDGHTGTGTFAHRTDVTGCATGSVTTSDIPGSSTPGSAGTLHISAAGQTADVDITTPVIHSLTIKVVAPDTGGTPPGPPGDGTYTVNLSTSGGGFSPPNQAAACSVTGPTPAAGTVCGTFTFDIGTTVGLSATSPDTALAFVGWTGTPTTTCTATSASTSATMTGDVTCTATWGPPAP